LIETSAQVDQSDQSDQTDHADKKIRRFAQIRESLGAFWQIYRMPVSLWFALRVACLIIPIVAGVLFPYSDGEWVAKPAHPPNPNLWMERLIRTWVHWDGGFYNIIAREGYIGDAHAAFFPLYPHLIRWFAWLFAFGNTRYDAINIAGIILSSVAALGVFILLYRLAREDYDEETAKLTVLYLAAFPVSFYFFAVYTEAIFLLLIVGAFLLARRQYWLWAMVLTALAVLCKNQGILVCVALAVEYLNQRKWDWRRIFSKTGLYFLLPIGAFAGWLGYNAIAFGNPLKFIGAQNSFERSFAFPWETLRLAHRRFFEFKGTNTLLPPGMVQDSIIYDYPITLFFVLVFLVGCYVAWRKGIRLSYIVLFGLCLFQPLTSPNKTIILLGMPRYILIIFPAFMLLALAGKRWTWLHYLYLAISLPLGGLLLARLALNYWV
jgi:Dolichyl-phosphate-mannose-protein mannosyltransferase